jgi:BirA family transcriptional regulator, biotin operon repressor / biotin---[acetyl-CoA-carboxylase] ligase
MIPRVPFDQWQARLQASLDSSPGPLWKVLVVREADSTQDAARRMNARAGDVIVAWRQTSGRGRLGRAWEDTGEDGVAMTLVVARDRPERLAIASAVATTAGLTKFCEAHGLVAGIKWPNDILINGRKVAGILIEQVDDCAFVGIGINVHQLRWPEALASRAISFQQLGVEIDRLAVMSEVMLAVQSTFSKSDAWVTAQFLERDVLRGSIAAFRCGEREVRGTVRRLDPMHGLAVFTESEGEVWLPAATTSVLHGQS